MNYYINIHVVVWRNSAKNLPCDGEKLANMRFTQTQNIESNAFFKETSLGKVGLDGNLPFLGDRAIASPHYCRHAMPRFSSVFLKFISELYFFKRISQAYFSSLFLKFISQVHFSTVFLTHISG